MIFPPVPGASYRLKIRQWKSLLRIRQGPMRTPAATARRWRRGSPSPVSACRHVGLDPQRELAGRAGGRRGARHRDFQIQKPGHAPGLLSNNGKLVLVAAAANAVGAAGAAAETAAAHSMLPAPPLPLALPRPLLPLIPPDLAALLPVVDAALALVRAESLRFRSRRCWCPALPPRPNRRC